jgi:hypothetical protein
MRELTTTTPGQLLTGIRRTLFGYCASEPVEPVEPQDGDDEWGKAAFWAFEDICELIENQFPGLDAN